MVQISREAASHMKLKMRDGERSEVTRRPLKVAHRTAEYLSLVSVNGSFWEFRGGGFIIHRVKEALWSYAKGPSRITHHCGL